MRNSKFTKVLTLASFITLISLFVIYRGGYLDNFFEREDQTMQTSPNGGIISQKDNNTIQTKKDSSQKVKTMLSSSKSVIITDNVNFVTDTTIKKKDSIKLSNEEIELMGSSKSAIIFKPKIKPADSTKTKKDKKNK